MPSHLEQIPIEIDKQLEEWEADHKEEYTASKAVPPARLQTCGAAGQTTALASQGANVVEKLFPDLFQRARAGIFQADGPPGSYISTDRDQILIPIRITKEGAYVAQHEKSQHRINLSLSSAVFCVANQPAFISDGVWGFQSLVVSLRGRLTI
ncbi:hypothetical protein BCR34DRAFT_592528 [Clohesyomyces aquaticus]|uniref:Uncharacterized protein n=1 Tax=Clohesyomyces aquaticus TaxID=1231657 RepID=A0A1Y1YRE2_9PLEO|nr:hypothetical protein BCR34DRAFT_592528 [Clohesyomyces aquaticus]